MQKRKWISSLLALAFCFNVFSSVHAQSAAAKPNLRFEHLAVEDGLPHSTVLGVLQDQQGFMWFATEDGLSRYDGINFKNFQHERSNPNSLTVNNTFALLESNDGLIWVGTDPGGLNVYNPKTGKFSVYQHDEDNPNSLADDSVWSLLEDSKGRIWAGTRNGLSRLDRDTGIFTNYYPDDEDPNSLASSVIYRIYEDSQGTIWLGTPNGLQRYNPQTDDFTTFVHDEDDEESLSKSNVWSIFEDSQGNFWVGTRRRGLNIFDRDTGKVTRHFYHDPDDPTTLSDDNIWNIFEDSRGRMWFLTEFGGLNLYDPQADVFYAYEHNPNDSRTISNNDLFWITEDHSGVLWITSRYGGVNKLYDGLSQFGLYRSIPESENSLNANEVYSIQADEDGTVWFGTFGGGLNCLDRNTGEMTYYMNDPDDPNSLSNDKVYYLHRATNGVLWVATYGGGLNRFNPLRDNFTVFTNTEETPYGVSIKYPTTLEDAKDGKLWIGTLGFGVLLFNPKTAEIEQHYEENPDDPDGLTEGTIYDMAYDGDGYLWIATGRGGLEMLDTETGIFTHHLNDPDDDNSILSNGVHALYWDETKGIMWAATTGGLSGYHIKSATWINFTREDGLPSDTLNGIQPGRNGNLWISSTKGISQLTFSEEAMFRNFSAADGLQGDQFQIASSHLGPDGEIFFGGSNGVTHFIPDELTHNPYRPLIVLTDFLLNDQVVLPGNGTLEVPIENTKTVNLPYEKNAFTIRFAALNYQQPEKNLYQYKLEGFDDDWSPIDYWHSARYTNIPPGEYTFIVRGANNNGIWDPVGARLQINILAPWWQKTWFRLLSAALASLLIFGAFQFRVRNIRSINQELEKRVAENTDALRFSQKKLYNANAELEMKLDEISTLQVQLKEQTIHDPLTGLCNRRHLSDILAREIPRAQRENIPLVFVLLDLDHFKQVNDVYGHIGGDKALIALGKLLKTYTRTNDYSFRYGGEEFMVLMTNIDLPSAYKRAEELLIAVQSLEIEHEGRFIPLTTSIGLASFPQHGNSAETLLLAMDDALYQAKHHGRNRVEIYRAKE